MFTVLYISNCSDSYDFLTRKYPIAFGTESLTLLTTTAKYESILFLISFTNGLPPLYYGGYLIPSPPGPPGPPIPPPYGPPPAAASITLSCIPVSFVNK